MHVLIFGHHLKLGGYIEDLKRSNLGGSFIVQNHLEILKEVFVFQRMFVSFDGLKNGPLSGCIHVLCIDDSFSKTFLGGCLLSSIGMDGNN